MTLTDRYPVAQVVARSSGRISELYASDDQHVKKGAWLAVIENPAKTDDVLSLKERKEDEDENVQLSLGDVQSSYTSYLSALHEFKNFYGLNYFSKKIRVTQEQLQKYRQYYMSQERQQQVMEAQYILAREQYKRDSVLFARGVISPSEHETARSTLLQSRYSLEGGFASLENLLIQIGDLENTILDIELLQAEKEAVVIQNYRSELEQLTNAINSWELTYCLKAPIDGTVTFVNYWNENQFVTSGESVFSIVPDEKEELIGRAQLPIERSGKVKTGQRVIIRFNNFPDQEFGIVNGVVNTISLVPLENLFQVEIGLPKGLVTNYGKTLTITHEMKASAEIVTEDLLLIERFIMPLKKILNEGFSSQSY